MSIVEGGGYGGVTSGSMAQKFIYKYRDKYVLKKQDAEKKKQEEEKKKQDEKNKNLKNNSNVKN